MESLRLFGDASFSAVQSDGGGGICRSFGVSDLAGEYDSALDGFSQHCLARLGILIPAKCLAGQEGIPEPFQCDEGVTAAFGFSKRGAEFLHAGVEVGGIGGIVRVLI